MPTSLKLNPIERELDVLIDQAVGGTARSAILAEVAGKARDEALAGNTRALGVAPAVLTYVDGTEGGALEAVKPDGQIVFEFDLVKPVADFIARLLRADSPIGRTGKYVASHRLFVNGAEVDELADGFKISEVVFIPTVPYARPIEAGESKQSQVPREGVYHATATLARARFGRVAKIDFAWRGVSGVEGVQPAVVVKVR